MKSLLCPVCKKPFSSLMSFNEHIKSSTKCSTNIMSRSPQQSSDSHDDEMVTIASDLLSGTIEIGTITYDEPSFVGGGGDFGGGGASSSWGESSSDSSDSSSDSGSND